MSKDEALKRFFDSASIFAQEIEQLLYRERLSGLRMEMKGVVLDSGVEILLRRMVQRIQAYMDKASIFYDSNYQDVHRIVHRLTKQILPLDQDVYNVGAPVRLKIVRKLADYIYRLPRGSLGEEIRAWEKIKDPSTIARSGGCCVNKSLLLAVSLNFRNFFTRIAACSGIGSITHVIVAVCIDKNKYHLPKSWLDVDTSMPPNSIGHVLPEYRKMRDRFVERPTWESVIP